MYISIKYKKNNSFKYHAHGIRAKVGFCMILFSDRGICLCVSPSSTISLSAALLHSGHAPPAIATHNPPLTEIEVVNFYLASNITCRSTLNLPS